MAQTKKPDGRSTNKLHACLNNYSCLFFAFVQIRANRVSGQKYRIMMAIYSFSHDIEEYEDIVITYQYLSRTPV